MALLYAFAELKELADLQLVLVGDGPEYDTIQATIESLGLEKQVTLAGNRDDARKLYRAFDVFALVSTNEGLPMVLLEAMAAEVPVIASRVGAIPDVIHDGESGLLIAPDSGSELVKSVRVLYTDCALRRQLADVGKQIIRQAYSSLHMAGEYNKQYETVYNKGQ